MVYYGPGQQALLGGHVPSKIHPSDWDRLFAPNAPRRGGPLRAFVNIVITAVVVVLLFVGGRAALRYRDQRNANLIATATAAAATVYPLQTATALARAEATATRVALRTATAIAAQPTAEPSLGIGVVTNGGNLRREPRLAPETVIGLIWPGDQIMFLERRDVEGQTWFRIRLAKAADNRGGEGVAPGTDGWASATLLSQPTPVPTATP
jgi:hypothetical protein